MKQLTVLSLTALLTAWTALRPSAGVTTASASAAATAPMAALFFRTAMGREARPAFAAALPRAEGGHGAGLAFAPARLWVAAARGRRTELTAAPMSGITAPITWRLWVPWRLLWRHRRCDPRLFGLRRDRSGRSRLCDDRCCEHVAVATTIDRRREWRRVSGALHTVYREGNQLTGAAVAGKG